MTIVTNRRIVLGDLVAFGQVGIEIVLAGKGWRTATLATLMARPTLFCDSFFAGEELALKAEVRRHTFNLVLADLL